MSGEHKSPNRPGGRDGQYPESQVPSVEAPGTPSGGTIAQYPEGNLPSVEFKKPTTSGDPFQNSIDMTGPADQLGPVASPGEPRIEKSARSL